MTLASNKVVYQDLLNSAIKVYQMPNGGAGGNLHIILDDCNIRRSDIDFCYSLDLNEIEKECLDLISLASKTQLKKLVSGGSY